MSPYEYVYLLVCSISLLLSLMGMYFALEQNPVYFALSSSISWQLLLPVFILLKYLPGLPTSVEVKAVIRQLQHLPVMPYGHPPLPGAAGQVSLGPLTNPSQGSASCSPYT